LSTTQSSTTLSTTQSSTTITTTANSKETLPIVESGGDRGAWGGKLEFILTCISYAVGLGNVWRFPYLCYKNGGGAFLIPYIVMLTLVGLPIFFLEMAFGQFASLGPLAIWKVSPLWKGLGYAMVISSALISIYYTVIIAYTLYFLFASMQSPVPWASCGVADATTGVVQVIEWWLRGKCVSRSTYNTTLANGTTASLPIIFNGIRETNLTLPFTVASASEHYFYDRVLDITAGVHDEGLGPAKWHLSLCLLLSWILVALALIKGVETLGKVSYVTAIFPYILLTVLIINGALLPGAADGITFYLKPDFSKLANPDVWKDAAVQIFYSLGVCTGGLITMSSFNEFRNNCLKDAVIVAIINCFTSVYAGFAIFAIIGYMAHISGLTVDKVATGGPGLAFVVYPEGLALLPAAPFWGVLFFFMMFILGMGSTLSMMENVLSSLLDEFPRLRSSPWRNVASRSILCLICFLLGIPMVTRGGMYLLNLVDVSVSNYPLLIIAILELIVLNYVYGYQQFADDVHLMLGKRPNIYFQICWRFLSGAVIIAIIIFSIIDSKPIDFNGYLYPDNYKDLGWLIQATPILAIVVGVVVCLLKGSPLCLQLRQEVDQLSEPKPDWGPAKKENRQGKYAIAAKKESNNINNKISFIDEDVNQNTLDNNNKNENGVSFTNEGADVFDTYL